jgi:hypothetical protein
MNNITNIEVERLQRALEVYANPDNWVRMGMEEIQDVWAVQEEHGFTLARKTLEGGEP